MAADRNRTDGQAHTERYDKTRLGTWPHLVREFQAPDATQNGCLVWNRSGKFGWAAKGLQENAPTSTRPSTCGLPISAKIRIEKELGITAALKPFRWWTNTKRRMKRKIGYESEAGRMIRNGPPTPGGCLVVIGMVTGAGIAVGTVIHWLLT